MRVVVPGTTAKRSPSLTSSTFSILPNATYTLSFQTKTSGLSYPLTVFVLIENSVGGLTQLNLSGPTGTNDWSSRKFMFTTSANAVQAHLQSHIYNGYGTAWLDDVQLTEVFGGRMPVAFGGAVTSDAGGLTQTSSSNGLNLRARFTKVGSAIRVDATLTDTTQNDRAVELSFGLPVDLPGGKWDQDPITSIPIVDGTSYDNLAGNFGLPSHSLYPFAVVRNADAAFCLATPMVPQMNRFRYDRRDGFRVTWDLGISPATSKAPSTAAVSFWIYTTSPRWGFRSAAEEYYWLNPDSFVSVTSQQGAWLVNSSKAPPENIPNSQDFGWAFLEGDANIDFASANGLLTLHYIEPSGWARYFPGYTTQPPYNVLVSALHGDAAQGTGTEGDEIPVSEMAQAVINCSPYDFAGRYQVEADSYFWYANKYQFYPLAPDPEIPAPSVWSVLKKYCIDGRIQSAQEAGSRIDGFFLDDVTSTFAAVENHRRDLWSYSGFPLTFSYDTTRVMTYDGFSMAELFASLRTYVHPKGLALMGSLNPPVYAWFAPSFDILGGEVNGADSLSRSYVRRVLGYGRPWTNLYVPNGAVTPGAADVLAYLRQALFLGYFPGFNETYWKSAGAFERDRSLFKQYIPLIRTVSAAGWRPVNAATSSDPAVYLERFDDGRGDVFYLTAQNSGGSKSTVQIALDAPTLGIGDGAVEARDLVRDKALTVVRSGSDIHLSDTLDTGETILYRITAPRSGPPQRGRTRVVVRD